MMHCTKAREKWELYHDSEGDSQLYQRLNKHLDECPACAHWFREQDKVEDAIAAWLYKGVPTAELWTGIHKQLQHARPASSSAIKAFVPLFALIASILVALVGLGYHLALGPEETQLSNLAAACHHRLIGGRERLQFESRSDLDVESYLKERVSFPVRCPPRQDAGFEVRGGGVCSIGGAPAAYVHGFVGISQVSIFILPVERLADFSREREALLHADIHHCRVDESDMVVAVIDRNIVIVVGQGSRLQLEKVVRAYGTYPDAHGQDSA